MSKKKVTEQVKELIESFINENNLELFDIQYVKEGSSWVLRIIIDKANQSEEIESYISTDDCEMVSRFASEELDKLDTLGKQYLLEVTSPGLDRPLRNEADYIKYKGKIMVVYFQLFML